MVAAVLGLASAGGEEPTFQDISCLKAEVARLRASGQAAEAIADAAVANCEHLVAGAAQASVDEMPELLAADEELGMTSAQVLEGQKQIAREASGGMALFILAEEQKDQPI